MTGPRRQAHDTDGPNTADVDDELWNDDVERDGHGGTFQYPSSSDLPEADAPTRSEAEARDEG